MKKIIFPLLTFFLLLTGSGSQAFAQNELVRITSTKRPDSVQLHFSFVNQPEFHTNIDKRRIDIQFANTKLAQDFRKVPVSKNIVKILSREFEGQLVFSFFFRYQPQDFRVDPSIKNTIVLNVTLGNEYSKSYNDLAKRLKGVSVLDRDSIDFTNPYIKSPYTKDWLSFFKDFEPKVTPHIAVSFTTPPFPIISLLPPGKEKNKALLDKEMYVLANQGLWRQLAATIAKKIKETKDIEQQKLLALTYGEALARAGDFKPAYQQLYLLNERYNEEKLAVYALYWLNLLRAIVEDPLLASYEFDKLVDMVADSSPLAPYYLLSRIETALAARDYRKLNMLLQKDNIALPPEIENRITIRQADYWQAIDESIRAYASYNLLSDSALIKSQPYSYNNFCSTLYAQKKFKESAVCFDKLAEVIKKNPARGLVNYQEEMAKLHFTPFAKLISQFSFIESAYPETEAHYLAKMKETDLLLLKNPEKADKLTGNYKKIAEQSNQRNICETALFKEILLQKILNNNGKAIDMALDFLRDFQSGDIRISAQALLIELVPQEIKRLVNHKQYIEALVLARKNRALFEKNWIKNKFLVDIAEAYQQLGLFDEAQKLYLYLIEIMPTNQKEQFYPVMIQAALNSGNYILLDDYASQYIHTYPEGKFHNDILFLRLQALVIRNKLPDAMELLPNPVPDEPRFLRIEADIMFQLDNYVDCIESLNRLELSEQLNTTERFMMAESLFNTSNYDSAQLEYESLPQNHEFHDQILYRRAEIANIKGDRQMALNLLKEIAEKGKNNFWKDLAARELQYNELKDIF